MNPNLQLKLITISLLATIATGAFAQSDNYTMTCGSASDLRQLAAKEGMTISNEEMREFGAGRVHVLDVLENGKAAIKRLLDLGSKEDLGSFPALVTCGVIVELKDEIKANGCADLLTNEVVLDNGGVKACEDHLKKIRK